MINAHDYVCIQFLKSISNSFIVDIAGLVDISGTKSPRSKMMFVVQNLAQNKELF